jgi:hypothetical protein
MTERLTTPWPETWIAHLRGAFMVVRASAGGEWAWEIIRERWFHRTETVAQGHVSGPLITAQRAAEDEAERRGLLLGSQSDAEELWK